MANYHLLALDLDETLLTKDKRISDENKKWIGYAQEAGVIVIFATGRGLQRVEDLRKELNLNTPMVLVNGAEVWGKSGELLKRSLISRNNIHMLHQIAEHAGARYWGYSVDSLVGYQNWKDEMIYTKDWLKFGIRHQDLHVIKKVREQVRKLPSLEITSSAPTNIEVGPHGISKETGVRKVCEYLGIGMEEVMAVGDNLNDFRLIKAAGFGVAMGNADPQLKFAADAVTDSNERDGVAKAIKQYLLNGSDFTGKEVRTNE